ncbi:hypothetical protein [Streptomyces sp. NPDC057429]|uniref:SCO2400 family protein n=1 Tax=Streptomyces sp. NPDC057429 TaxID=3346130 RepID=UPI003676FD91
MDYCHPCRRHLNGALACAGCGTPAEALVPYAGPAYSGHEPERPGETLEPVGAGGHRRRARDAAARGRGRRAHRRRGRGVLLAALGVLLAVGALSLAELAIEPGGDDGAAQYVSESSASAAEAVPDASVSSVPDDAPGPVDAPTTVPVPGSRSPEGDPSGSAEPDGPGPSASDPASADAPPPSSSPSTPPDPDGSEPPAGSSSPAPTVDPTQPEPPEDPGPTPSPSETCTRWLWFCT